MENPTEATIIMIEDNPTHRQMYTMQFIKDGFSNFMAYGDAEEGISAIIQEKPQLVLLDVSLIETDGLTVLKQLKDNKETKDIPVIMLSNMRKEDKGKQAKALGARDYYVKAEYTPEDIVGKVIKVLKQV